MMKTISGDRILQPFSVDFFLIMVPKTFAFNDNVFT